MRKKITYAIDRDQLSQAVRQHRGEKRLLDACAELSVSTTMLSHLERGLIPSMPVYLRLCAWLGVKPGAFIHEVK